MIYKNLFFIYILCVRLQFVISKELKIFNALSVSKEFKILNVVHNGPESISFDVPIHNNTPWTIGDGVSFILPLASGETVTVMGKIKFVKRFENSNQPLENIYVHGVVPSVTDVSSEAGTFSIAFYSDSMSANIQYPDDIQYELRPSTVQQNTNGLTKSYVMSKVDMVEKYYSKEVEEFAAKKRLFKSQSQSELPSKTVKNVELEATVDMKILMIYTKEAVLAAGGETSLLSIISLAIGNYNVALQNSLVDITVSYVAERMQEYDTFVEDNGADPFGAMLGQMDTTISTSRRNLLSCHAVQLVISKTQYCGLGYYNFNGYTSGYSVGSFSCIGGYMTTAHEVGHNLGLEHDVSVSPDTASNHGYCWDDAASAACHRSIMSYASCVTPLGRSNCARVKYFSNPDVQELGNVVGTKSQCNNAQQLRNNINNFVNQFTSSFTPDATVSPSYSRTPSRLPTFSPSKMPGAYPSITPTSASPLVNSGFQNGLTAWTSTGTVSSMTIGCWSGSCARLGSTVATNGDSTLSQSFVPVDGQTQLKIYFWMSCPDVVTNDWATIRVTDTATGSYSYMSNQCLPSGWYSITFNLTPGRAYTVTLTNHDDNNAALPTYTLFDELTLISAPTATPSAVPISSPSFTPTIVPSIYPSFIPSITPTATPSFSPIIPSLTPIAVPTATPIVPSITPSTTSITTTASSIVSSSIPPSLTPFTTPTAIPVEPSVTPSAVPTTTTASIVLTATPTRPTVTPTKAPLSKSPSKSPIAPTTVPTKAPISKAPTKSPIAPTKAPTKAPLSKAPTKAPISKAPTKAPLSKAPTKAPLSKAPTKAPIAPTKAPTKAPF